MSKIKQVMDRKGLSQLRNVVRRLGLSLYRGDEMMRLGKSGSPQGTIKFRIVGVPYLSIYLSIYLSMPIIET